MPALSLPRLLAASAPALLGYGASAFCPVRSGTGAEVAFRPPPAAFGVVWPALYVLLGASAYLASPLRAGLHVGLAVMLAAWIPLDACLGRAREGVWLLALCALACCYVIATDPGRTTLLLLLPLLAWLCFAVLMAAFRAQLSEPPGRLRDKPKPRA